MQINRYEKTLFKCTCDRTGWIFYPKNVNELGYLVCDPCLLQPSECKCDKLKPNIKLNFEFIQWCVLMYLVKESFIYTPILCGGGGQELKEAVSYMTTVAYMKKYNL